MTDVMKPRIRHDPGRVARLGPEPPQVICPRRFVSALAGKHPLTRRRIGDVVQHLPRGLAEQNVPRPGLRVNQGQAVGFDLAPAQAAYLPRPTPGQQEQAHRRNTPWVSVFSLALPITDASPRELYAKSHWSRIVDPTGVGFLINRRLAYINFD